MVRQKINPLYSTMYTKYLLLIHHKYDTLRAIKKYRNNNPTLFPEVNKDDVTDNAIRNQIKRLVELGILTRDKKLGKSKPFTINYLRLAELLMDDKISQYETSLENYNLYKGVAPNIIAGFTGEYSGEDIKRLKELKDQILKFKRQEYFKVKFEDSFDILFSEWTNQTLINGKVYYLREIFHSWLSLLKDLKEGDSALGDFDGKDVDSRLLEKLSEFAFWVLYVLEFKDPVLHRISDSVLRVHDSTAFLKSRS